MKLHKKTEKLCAPNTKLSYEWYGYEIYKFWVELSSKITENRQIIHFLCTYALPIRGHKIIFTNAHYLSYIRFLCLMQPLYGSRYNGRQDIHMCHNAMWSQCSMKLYAVAKGHHIPAG